jgi:hypothetical protein
METKHTKGEWRINKYSQFTVEVNGRSVASTGSYQSNIDSQKIHEENIANAKLISAAPNLLRALRIGLELLYACKFTSNDDQIAEMEEAIKKAITI